MKIRAQLFYTVVFVIDCFWWGFGAIHDRFDPISPPEFIASNALVWNKHLVKCDMQECGPKGPHAFRNATREVSMLLYEARAKKVSLECQQID